MPGLKQMSSTSSGGASVITLQFELAKPLDVAEQEVQAAINAAYNLLPNDLPQPPVYSKVNPADTPILTLAVTSATLPLPQVQDLVDTRLAQKLSQLPGVGLVSIAGGQRPAVRIQANPQALAAVRPQPRRTCARRSPPPTSTSRRAASTARSARSRIDANDQLRSAEDYTDLIVAYRDGAPIRLRDVADVVDGAENRRLAAWANELPAVHHQRPAPARRQRHRGRRPHQASCCRSSRASLPARVEVAVLTDRTDDHPRLGATTCSSS